MRDSKKTLITIALFLLFLAAYSFLVIRPYENSRFATENDRSVREELAGQLDTIITGASHAEYGIDNVRMDEALGTFSYNLSGPWQSTYGTLVLLEKELDRNPVRKVYLVISEDTFRVGKDADDSEGDVKILPRLDNIAERADYLANAAALKELPDIYQDMLNRGFTYATSLLGGNDIDRVDAAARGYSGKQANSVKLSEESAAKAKNSRKLKTNVEAFNMENMDAVAELCKSRGIEVQVIVVPVSDRAIWTMKGWDKWYKTAKEYCEKHGFRLWDFNLYRGRFSLFNDKDCYRNSTHLSKKGAEIFSDLLVEVIQRDEAGEDVTPDFYSTYGQMKKHSPYAK